MLTPDLLHDYQKRAAVNSMLHARDCPPYGSIPGLKGKTVTTLTSAAHLLNTGFLRGVLVVAPIRVCADSYGNRRAKRSGHTSSTSTSC